MNRRASLPLLLALAVTTPTTGQSLDDPKVPLAAEIPALADLSSWRLDTELGRQEKRNHGAYPIGNGHSLAWFEFDRGQPANRLSGIRGPNYGHQPIGSLSLSLAVDGTAQPIELRTQRIRRIRGASFVVTEDRSEQLSLRTLTFAAPFNRTELIRLIQVENVGAAKLTKLMLRSTLHSEKPGAIVGDTQSFNDGKTFAQIRLGGGRAEGMLQVGRIGTLAPGASWTTTQRITLSATPLAAPAERSGAALLADVRLEALASVIAWRDALANTTQYRTDHTRLNDLIGDWKVMLRVLQCAKTGLVISSDTTDHVRLQDLRGPMLAFLRYRMWDEAKLMLNTVFAAARATGSVPKSIPLAFRPAQVAAIPIDWDALRVPEGDCGPWTILLHHWYWRATQDTDTIRKHWPLLDRCMKGRYAQRSGELDLLPFGDDDAWLNAGLYPRIAANFDPRDWPRVPDHIANAPASGRTASSFVGGVLLLVATQSLGELLDGVDRSLYPEKYAKGGDKIKRPGEIYTRRTFAMMAKLEQAYWLADEGRFAPAISPVTGERHTAPYANANLMPLWAGWTFPTGEKSRDNLKNTLARLGTAKSLPRTTERIAATTGDLNGMLLTALSERDCQRRMDVLGELLEQAKPAGTWSRFGDGYQGGLATSVSCINLDAIIFALTGIRHVAVPNWDNKDIRLELRLPAGATFFSVRNTCKDGRTLNLSFTRIDAPLDDAERKANAELDADKRRDPEASHSRMKFVIDLVDGKPAAGYYDVAVNAVGTMFVRFLWDDATKMIEHNGEQVQQTPRRIEEQVFWEDDKNEFFPAAGTKRTPEERLLPKSAKTLEFRALPTTAIDAETVLFDSGIPFTPDDLERTLFDGDTRRYATIRFDASFALPFPATPFIDRGTPKSWANLLTRFEKAGGKIVRPDVPRPLSPVVERDHRKGPVEQDRVEEILTYLASDELAGRDTPSAGQRLAAQYLANAFEHAGLQQSPGLDTWFHDYSLSGTEIDSTKVAVTVQTDAGPLELKAGADIRVWRSGRPFENEAVTCRITKTGSLGGRRSSKQPTLVVIDASSPIWRAAADKRSILSRRLSRSAPTLLVRKGLLPDATEIEASVMVEAPQKVAIPLQNVVAAWPGKTDEWIVVSSHYDHIGLSLGRPGDVINNGADDDGTGTTAVLALAEAFAKSKTKLRRGILFVCFSGEEKGLLGSAAFAKSPPFPLDRVAANLNLEMLGRPDADKHRQAWVTGASLSDFEAICKKGFARAGIEVVEFRMAERLFFASDNYSLFKKGVIAHSISAGSLHEDYHKPSDEVEKIEFEHMTAVINGLYEVVTEFASREARPVLVKQNEDTRRRRR